MIRLFIAALGFTGIAALTALGIALVLDSYPAASLPILFAGYLALWVWILLILPEALGARRR